MIETFIFGRPALKKLLKHPLFRKIWAIFQGNPASGRVNFGDLRSVKPLSSYFGFDRGLPIDRYYIEQFLQAHTGDIKGRALEISARSYTIRFGGNRVAHSDVLHKVPGNPVATIVADLTSAHHIPSEIYDCAIITQTLHLIYDVRAALQTLYRVLKPGGVLLITFPGLSQMTDCEWHWGFTRHSAMRLFEEVFPKDNIEITVHGNVLTSVAFLQGIAAEELKKEELEYRDPAYDLLITVRAVRPI